MSDQSNNISALHIENDTCPTVAYQNASICVPVTVTPFIEVGKTTTHCCGCPIIEPGEKTCCGTVHGNCSFTITQDICVAIPIAFGAHAIVGDPSIEMGEVTTEFEADND